MATTSKIIRWVAGKVLDRAPADGEVPSELDLIEAIEADRPGIVEAQAQAAELAASVLPWGDDLPAVERWRWQAMGGPRCRDRNPRIARRDRGAPRGWCFAAGLRVASCDPDPDPVRGVFVWDLPDVHRHWLAADGAPRHPLTPLVAAWLETRPRKPDSSTVDRPRAAKRWR